jgi:pimeloyl-ACP methyl ester carboxylesterase
MERHLRKNGYSTTNWGYRSFRDSLPVIGKQLYDEIRAGHPIDTVDFVTHSMGGLVVRSLLAYAREDSLFPVIHRIVMLSPPNHGSELADFFAQSRIVKMIVGPNLEMMGTDSGTLANRLPIPEKSELGIIAGAKFSETGYNPFIKGDNDGFLTPGRMKLGSEKEFITIQEVHFLMPQNKDAKKYVLNFLAQGQFSSAAIGH